MAKSACASVACFSRSDSATTEASAVSLITETQFEAWGGMTMRIACGRITLRIVTQKPRPRAEAASNWPLGVASIPARTTSAVKAASTMVSAAAAAAKDESVIPAKGSA